MKLKKSLCTIIIFILFILTACNNSYLGFDSDTNSLKFFNSSNSGKSNHNKDKNESSYTLLVYMCGSDLESEEGYATKDLEEMCKAECGSNVSVIVETGGTRHWDNDVIDKNKLNRYKVSNGYVQLIESLDSQSMGESDTLADFLKWGIKEYPSDRTGVILWDHGSGAAYGVCFDELFDDDSLYLSEIEEAFEEAYNETGITFDFVGFDACMMATIETAGVLSNYAGYMIASQDVESGCGWNYTKLLDFISENMNINGNDIGRKVCNDYIEDCHQTNEQDGSTMSCIDLSKYDQFETDFYNFSKNLISCLSDNKQLKNILKAINSTKNYGGNNPFEGYTNMLDIGDMLKNLENVVDGAKDTEQSLNEMIAYQSTGRNHKLSTGLSVYYPLRCQSSKELKNIGAVSISPYYTGLVNYVAFNAIVKDQSKCDMYDWTSTDPDYWNRCSFYEQIDDEQKENYKIEFLKDDGIIKLTDNTQITDDGYFTATVNKNLLDYVQGVYSTVFAAYGENSLMYLGKDNNVYYDSETGKITDNFWGGWGMLPDGQLLTMEIAEEEDDYNVYTIPILLNGEKSNMRVEWLWTNDTQGYYKVLGTWNGIEDNGSSDRDLISINKGDTITPVYTIYNMTTGDTTEEYGEEYKVGRDFGVKDDYLPENDYYYSFEISDIYGGTVFTDTAIFYIDENGEVWYYKN